jgi:hypothetical protein
LVLRGRGFLKGVIKGREEKKLLGWNSVEGLSLPSAFEKRVSSLGRKSIKG